MRAIHIFIILIIIILGGCTTVEIAKEVTKATKSIKTTIEKITTKQEEVSQEEVSQEEIEKVDDLKQDKEEIVLEKKKEEAVLIKQKKIIIIKVLGETLDQLTQKFGNPTLVREDGNTKTARFDTSSCRLFIYFDLMIIKSKAEYYEIRNPKGELIDKKEKIEKCFQEIQKT